MYDNRNVIAVTYIDQTVSTAAEIGEFTLPSGYKGVFTGCEFTTNGTATTDAATVINVGTDASATAYGTGSIPITAASTAASVTNTQTTVALDNGPAQPVVIPAGGTVMIDTDGGSTAGAGDLTVYFEIYK